MSKQTKMDSSVGQGLTREQASKALDSDLKTLSALLMWIRSTPAVQEMLVDFAMGQQANAINAKQQAEKAPGS